VRCGESGTCTCNPQTWVAYEDDPPETLEAVEAGLCPQCGGRLHHTVTVMDAMDRDL